MAHKYACHCCLEVELVEDRCDGFASGKLSVPRDKSGGIRQFDVGHTQMVLGRNLGANHRTR